MLSNLLGLDIIATLPNNIAVNQISDINNSGDKYGAYLAAIQRQVLQEGKTVAEIINSLVTPILGNAALGTAGANFLAAVNAVISNPDINPTGVTRLPDSLTIQGAISAPVPIPSMTDTTPPSAPSGLSANLDNAKTVRLTWNASTDNIAVAGYTVFRNGNVIAEVKSPGYFDGSGIALASYDYTVKAFDAARNVSASSNQATIALPAAQADLSPPSTPLALVPSFTGGNSITLIWNRNPPEDNVAGYFIFRNSQKIASVLTPGYTDTPVEPNKIYRYQVQAFDAAGNASAPGNEATVVTLVPDASDTEPPSAPIFRADLTKITSSSISLSWTASTDNVGVAGYRIYRDNQYLDAVIRPPDIAGWQPGYTDGTVAASTPYTYKIEAFDAAGNFSPFSADLFLTTLAAYDTSPPTAPTGPVASSVTTTTITLAWGASSDNKGVVRYDVYRNGVKVGDTLGSIRTYNDTALTPGTAYRYKVQAFDAAGNFSPFSVELSVDTVVAIEVVVGGQLIGISGLPLVDSQAPSAPANLAATTFATSGATSSVVLTWSASTDNVWVAGHDVYRNNAKIATVSQPGYIHTGVTSGTTATYYVVAFDAATPQPNRSAPSSLLSVTPNVASLGVTVSGQVAGVAGLPLVDSQAPSAPANLSATTFATSGTASSVVLAWSASTDNVWVAGYDVYRNNTKIATVSQPGYIHTGVASGTTATYHVIAFDAAGNRSAQSSPLSVTPNQASLGVTVSGQVI